MIGTRRLIQAALTTAAPGHAVLALYGGQVDAVHSASMLLLAAVSRAQRRAAVTDALTEAAFAAAAARRRRCSVARGPRPVMTRTTSCQSAHKLRMATCGR